MKAQHTPGPWHVSPKGNVLDAQKRSVAVTDARDLYGECVANGRLIAAAPDLLAALQSILEHSGEFGSIEDAETMLVRVEDKARAAIAKATGETP